MGTVNNNASSNAAGNGHRIRTLVVDDDPLMRIALRLLLERDKTIHVVGTAGNSNEGYLLANSLRPHLVLTDFHMPDMDGLELTGVLSRDFPGTRIIIVTNDPDPELPNKCLAGGAHGFVTKNQLWHDLPTEIQRIFQMAAQPGAVPAAAG
jgi:DNA-binding NarL/FixJ family response regulator